MSSSKYAAGKFQKEILKALFGGFFSKNEISKDLKGSRSKYSFEKSLEGLIQKGLIELYGEKFKITKKGRELINNYDKQEITIRRDKWDGIWKIVAYDVPEGLKKERDHFRRKLIELGFTKMQGSLWLFPFECKEEIAILSATIGISDYVMYLKTDSVPNNTKYIKKYKL